MPSVVWASQNSPCASSDAEARDAEHERHHQVVRAEAEAVGERDPEVGEEQRRAVLAELHERPGERADVAQRAERAPRRRGMRVQEDMRDDAQADDEVGQPDGDVRQRSRGQEIKAEERRRSAAGRAPARARCRAAPPAWRAARARIAAGPRSSRLRSGRATRSGSAALPASARRRPRPGAGRSAVPRCEARYSKASSLDQAVL